MDKKSVCYTVTLARLYSNQGYYEKAVEILAYIIKKDPLNQAAHLLLAEIDKHMGNQGDADASSVACLERVNGLLADWTRLFLAAQHVKGLKRLKGRVQLLIR